MGILAEIRGFLYPVYTPPDAGKYFVKAEIKAAPTAPRSRDPHTQRIHNEHGGDTKAMPFTMGADGKTQEATIKYYDRDKEGIGSNGPTITDLEWTEICNRKPQLSIGMATKLKVAYHQSGGGLTSSEMVKRGLCSRSYGDVFLAAIRAANK